MARNVGKKRRVFDSTKARVTGGKADAEMAKYVADKKQADRKIAEGRRDSQGKRAKAQSAWKSKSSAFREAMRQGRAVQKALKDGIGVGARGFHFCCMPSSCGPPRSTCPSTRVSPLSLPPSIPVTPHAIELQDARGQCHCDLPL